MSNTIDSIFRTSFSEYQFQDNKANAIWACLGTSQQKTSDNFNKTSTSTIVYSQENTQQTPASDTNKSSSTNIMNLMMLMSSQQQSQDAASSNMSQTLQQQPQKGPKNIKSVKNSAKKLNKAQKKPGKNAPQNLNDKGFFRVDNVIIPRDVLSNLAARFILSMPDDEINDPIRICFQMELAFWYYTDILLTKQDYKLPTLKLRMFSYVMFHYIENLRKFLPVFNEVIGQWMEYKFSIPTYGAIILDPTLDYVLLVQGFGSKTWGFPKGKQNHSENPMLCASREVFEEIGFNCLNRMCESDYLERKVLNSKCRLYIITDIKMDFPFQPHVVNEIRDIQWFNVNELPVRMSNVASENFANKFYSVSPFVYSLRKWIAREKRRRTKAPDDKSRRTRYNSVGEAAQKSDDSGANSPYHMVETGPDIVEANNALNALFAPAGTVQSELEMHTKNVYHADLQQNLKSFTEKKKWPEVWQSLVNHYNSENDAQHTSKVDYDLKSKLSASTNNDPLLPSSGGLSGPLSSLFVGLNSRDNNQQSTGQKAPTPASDEGSPPVTTNNNPDAFNDKLNFLFNIGSEKRTSSSCSTPILPNNDTVRQLFSSPVEPSVNLLERNFNKASLSELSVSSREANVVNIYKGLSQKDAQVLSEPMVRLLAKLNFKRG